MPQGYDELIDTSSIAKLLEQLGKVPDAARDAGRAMDELGDKTGGVGKKGRRITMSGRDADEDIFAPGTRKSDHYGPPSPTANQIASNLKKEQAHSARDERLELRELMASSNIALRAFKQAERLRPKTHDELVRDAVMTSRILPDGTLSPIVGRMMKAGILGGFGMGGGLMGSMGMGKAAGALRGGLLGDASPAMVAELAAAAIPLVSAAAIGKLAFAAAGATRIGSNAFWQSGGTPGELAAGIALGGANAGGKAEAFGGFLRGGGYGAARLRQAGIVDMGDYFTPDKMGNYVKALDYLHSVKDPIERIRIARGSPLQEDLWTSDLSDESYKGLKQSRGNYSEEDRKREAEFRGAVDRVHNIGDRMLRTIGTPVYNSIAKILSPKLEDWDAKHEDQKKWVENKGEHGLFHPPGWVRMKDGLYHPPGHPEIYISDYVPGGKWDLSPSGKGGKGSDNAQGHTDSSGRTNYVYRSVKDGPDWSGGGERARGAVPAGIVGQNINDKFNYDKLHLGGISV